MTTRLFFLFLTFSFPWCSAAQTYTVLHTNGKIYPATTTTALQTGDIIKADQVLEFPGQQAWSIVLDATGEQYFIQQPTSADSTHRVKQMVQAIEKTAHPVTRSNKAPVQSLRNYFSGAQFVFIGDDFYLEVDPKYYPLDEKLFLLYRYEYNSRIITHKIPQVKNVIHFNKPFLYEHKGDSISYSQTWNTELSYFNSNTNLPVFAAGFRPLWLNEDALKKELLVLQKITAYKKMSRSELKKVFLQYVLDVYGKTDEIIFMDWLEQKVLRQK
jgi:hypothetical protein